MASARLSTRWKFSGPLRPRPPETMTWASVSWTLPWAVARTEATFARADASTLAFTTCALRDASGCPGGKTFGRRVAICGSPAHETVA